MTKKRAKPSMQQQSLERAGQNKPVWADGLRQLYDSVVNEPLPDSFTDLLAELDKQSGEGKK